MLSIHGDDHFMKQAIMEAQKGAESGEVPVGAVVVCQKQIIARSHNQTELLTDVTAHAEILALTAASSYLGSKYLKGCTLYVTLEPCAMCAGAISHARIARLYYAATDPKGGAVEHGARVLEHPQALHKPEVYSGMGEAESAEILRDFFKARR